MCIAIENKSTKFAKSAIKNDELRSYANMLATDAMNIRANLLHMSAIMATIASRRDEGILEEFNNSVVEFAESRLGIKKSQVYSMIQVGATFLDEGGRSRLPEKGAKWSNTQFMALLPMGGTGKNKKSAEETLEACKNLVNEGKIKPSMTVAEIKEVVKNERPDAANKAKKAQERKEKAESKKVKEAEAISKKENSISVNGDVKARLEFVVIDNKMHVIINGTESTYDQTFVNGVVNMLQKAVNFKM